ncbi:12804_t:CDS:1, partial [Cetraspora pellucida]
FSDVKSDKELLQELDYILSFLPERKKKTYLCQLKCEGAVSLGNKDQETEDDNDLNSFLDEEND